MNIDELIEKLNEMRSLKLNPALPEVFNRKAIIRKAYRRASETAGYALEFTIIAEVYTRQRSLTIYSINITEIKPNSKTTRQICAYSEQ